MNSSDTVVIVLYDFAYTSKDKRKIEVSKGEKLYLLEKTNADWWQVVRNSERRSFYVPAQYVEQVNKTVQSKYEDRVEYENLNTLLEPPLDLPSLQPVLPPVAAPSVAKETNEEIKKQKPVPKTRTKVTGRRSNYENAGIVKSESARSITKLIRDKSDKKLDRARSSDRLSRQESSLSLPNNSDNLPHINPLPETVDNVVYSNLPQLSAQRSRTSGKSSDVRGKPGDIGKNRMRNSYNLKVKQSKSFDYHSASALKLERKQSMPVSRTEQQSNRDSTATLSRSLEKLAEEIRFEPKKAMAEKTTSDRPGRRGKTDDVSRILDEDKTTKPFVFSLLKSFRSSKSGRKVLKKEKGHCVRSSSWEGGLDKVEELETKPLVLSSGLQRSKTFLVVEKSPFAARNTRLKIGYHSHVPVPPDKVRMTTFKPIPSSDLKKTEVYENIPISRPIEMQLAGESEEHLEEKMIVRSKGKKNAEEVQTAAALGSELTGSSRTAPCMVSQTSVDSKTSDSEDGCYPKKRPSIMRHNRVTAKPESPRTPSPSHKATRDMKDGWAEYSNGPRKFYYNAQTGHKSWKPPRGITLQDKEKLHTSKESVCSDMSRSNTSSPLNDPLVSSPSLTRSTVSLNSSQPSAGTKTPIPWSQSPSSHSLNTTKSSRESVGALDLEEDVLGKISVKERRDLLLQNVADDRSRREAHNFNTGNNNNNNESDPFEQILGRLKHDIESLERSMALLELQVSFTPEVTGLVTSISDMFHEDLVTDKPPVPPRRKRSAKMDSRTKESLQTNIKPLSRDLISKFENKNQTLEDHGYETVEEVRRSVGKLTLGNAEGDNFRRLINIVETSMDNHTRKMPCFPVAPKADLKLDSPQHQTTNVPRVPVKPRFDFEHYSPYFPVETKIDLKHHIPRFPVAPEDDLKHHSPRFPVAPEDDLKHHSPLFPVAPEPDLKLGELPPFPATTESNLEYEVQELLMMKRVTESSKEKRKPVVERRISCNYTIHEEAGHVDMPVQESEKRTQDSFPPSVTSNRLLTVEDAKVDTRGYRRQIIEFLSHKLEETEPRRNQIKLREDVIIDWANDYEGLSEPIVLEGKSLILRQGERLKIDASVSDRVSTCDRLMLGQNEGPKRRSVSSASDMDETTATYSDFESDINEAIAIGETWCAENSKEEGEDCEELSEITTVPCLDADSDDVSFTRKIQDLVTEKAFRLCGGKLDTGDELCEQTRPSIQITVTLMKTRSLSEDNLLEAMPLWPLQRDRSWRSLDFFRDGATEKRVRCKAWDEDGTESVSSDVMSWMTNIRGIVCPEDGTWLSDSKEWQSSTEDGMKERQDVRGGHRTSEGSDHLEQAYGIQRSSTESAICKQAPPKLRSAQADRNRMNAASRASKAHSMVLDNRNDLEQFKTNSMGRASSSAVKEGYLARTKTVENGKKLRKNWSRVFVVLDNEQIAFWKDEKAYRSGKMNNHPTDLMNLSGAVIDKGEKLSKRKNVYHLVAGNSEVLIQAESPAESDEWFTHISRVITDLVSKNGGLLPSGRVRPRETDTLESPTSESPQEAGSKNTKSKLKWFLSRRPTKEVLMKKGIYKDEQVFGRSLEDLTKNARGQPRVPEFVKKCIEVIEQDEKNLETDGLYRASGNLSQVQKIRLEVDQDKLQCLDEEKEVHVLTGSLKLFFRELKESLIPFKEFSHLKDKLGTLDHKRIEQSLKQKIEFYKEMVKNLPTTNRDTLKFLLAHLKRVEERNSANRMDINNLAIVFGPTLIWSENAQQDIAFGLMEQNTVVAFLLERFHDIF